MDAVAGSQGHGSDMEVIIMNLYSKMKNLEGKYIDLANFYKQELVRSNKKVAPKGSQIGAAMEEGKHHNKSSGLASPRSPEHARPASHRGGITDRSVEGGQSDRRH